MSTYSANHGDQFTSFFGQTEDQEKSIRASTVKFREPKKTATSEEQEVIDFAAEIAMAKTMPVKEMNIPAAKFRGMSAKFVNIMSVFLVCFTGFLTGATFMYAVLLIAAMIILVTGSSLLGAAVYIFGYIMLMLNIEKFTPICLTISKTLILGYTRLHQGIKKIYKKVFNK